MAEQAVQEAEPAVVVQAYIEALTARDLSRCVDFYADDAKITFISGVFRGKQAIKEWHEERFAAELELVSVGELNAKGEKVTLDVLVTSKKLRAWKLNKLAGRPTTPYRQGKRKKSKQCPR